MGYSLAWASVSEKDSDRILSALRLRETDETVDDIEEPIAATRSGNWVVVVEDKFPAQVLEQDRLLQLSVDADVLYCVVEEHMMLSHSSFFSGGTAPVDGRA